MKTLRRRLALLLRRLAKAIEPAPVVRWDLGGDDEAIYVRTRRNLGDGGSSGSTPK